jgi:hypothetical protein
MTDDNDQEIDSGSESIARAREALRKLAELLG